METQYIFNNIRIFCKFKSYYVVWKLLRSVGRRLMTEKFKSYYVVWKLGKYPTPMMIRCMFKSYYVVWKHGLSGSYVRASLPGLNRTMQYGNGIGTALARFVAEKFKSYYVVWKRGKSVDEVEIIEMFKSYYVVWKPTQPMMLPGCLTWFKSYYVVWKLFHPQHCSTGACMCLNRTMQYGNCSMEA